MTPSQGGGQGQRRRAGAVADRRHDHDHGGSPGSFLAPISEGARPATLQLCCPARARSDPYFDLDKRTSRRIIRQASLMMRNSRTKEREDVGWGYTNRTAGGQRE